MIICLFSASYILALAAAEAEKESNLAEVAEARFEDISVLEEAVFSLLSVEAAAAAADLTAAARFSALTDICFIVGACRFCASAGGSVPLGVGESEEDMWVVAVAMAMAPWITVSELRREPDCGVDGASSKESRLPPAAELATAAVGPFECLCIFRLAADMMPDMMSLAEISRPGLTIFPDSSSFWRLWRRRPASPVCVMATWKASSSIRTSWPSRSPPKNHSQWLRTDSMMRHCWLMS